MTTPNRIALICAVRGLHEEAVAIGACKPGHILATDSDGKVLKHATAGGYCERRIAEEDALQGKVITDAYAVGDVVSILPGLPGDLVLLRLPAAATAVVIGDVLISNGDGCVVKGTAAVYANRLYQMVADGTALSNTVTETSLGGYTIAANTLRAGDKIRIRGFVNVTATNSTNTLLLKVKIGSTILYATAAVDVADGDIGWFDIEITVRTIGGSGTIVAQGTAALGVPGTVTSKPGFLASTAIDTTATQAVTVTGTWSVASASNSCKLQDLTVDKTLSTSDVVQQTFAIAAEAVDNSAGGSEAFVRARLV